MQEAKPRPMTLEASEQKLQAPTKSVKKAASNTMKAHVPDLKAHITAADAARVLVANATLMASVADSILPEGPEARIKQAHETRASATRIPAAYCLVSAPNDSIRHAQTHQSAGKSAPRRAVPTRRQIAVPVCHSGSLPVWPF